MVSWVAAIITSAAGDETIGGWKYVFHPKGVWDWRWSDLKRRNSIPFLRWHRPDDDPMIERALNRRARETHQNDLD
jgi:hypothetical protein